jgi:hypothetical protein
MTDSQIISLNARYLRPGIVSIHFEYRVAINCVLDISIKGNDRSVSERIYSERLYSMSSDRTLILQKLVHVHDLVQFEVRNKIERRSNKPNLISSSCTYISHSC